MASAFVSSWGMGRAEDTINLTGTCHTQGPGRDRGRAAAGQAAGTTVLAARAGAPQ